MQQQQEQGKEQQQEQRTAQQQLLLLLATGTQLGVQVQPRPRGRVLTHQQECSRRVLQGTRKAVCCWMGWTVQTCRWTAHRAVRQAARVVLMPSSSSMGRVARTIRVSAALLVVVVVVVLGQVA
jgi:G:T/U-mismatch repair DNA glycosylase